MSRKKHPDGVLKIEDRKKQKRNRGNRVKKPRVVLPSEWFKRRYPKVSQKYGAPLEVSLRDKKCSVREINDDFFAALLGDLGHPDAPTVRLTGRFYTYKKDNGIFEKESDGAIEARISALLKQCSKECASPSIDTTDLSFRLSNSARLGGVIKRARALLEKPDSYFETDRDFVACKNGMLRMSDRKLMEFDPKYRVRNKLAVEYKPDAKCPRFQDKLLGEALEPYQIETAQLWCGMALLGKNISQKILLVLGTAGGGKSTFVKCITGIIGEDNIAELKPKLLEAQFSLYPFLDKTLLIGPDVSPDFLATESASRLKSLTGGDILEAELKHKNERVHLIGDLNVVITCNSGVVVHIKKDLEAWRRRLVILSYNKPKPEHDDKELFDKIMKEEASGILNWMLDGLEKLKAKDFDFPFNDIQRKEVDDLLMSSQAPEIFVREALEVDPSKNSVMTKAEVLEAHHAFCKGRQWGLKGLNDIPKRIENEIYDYHGCSLRNDIIPSSSKEVHLSHENRNQRGWVGLRLKSPDNPDSKS
jgi:putative DNA primase/helicase